MSQSHLFDHHDPQQAAIDIAELNPSEQPAAIEQWLVVFDGWVIQVARASQTSFGRGQAHHIAEDIAQITRQAAWKMLLHYCDNPDRARTVQSLYAVLRSAVRNNVRDEVERYETKGIVGIRAKHRRARELDDLTYVLAQQLGYTPSRAEVIKEWDKRNAGRKELKRQGRVVADDDFGFHKNTPSAFEHEDAYVEHYDEPDYVLMPLESQQFRDTVVEYATQQDQRLGAAAKAWLDEAQVGLRTEHGVYRAVRIAGGYKNLTEAKQAIEEIRALSIVLLREHYGIDSA